MTDALKILKAARAKIANPQSWGKGPRGRGGRRMETCCAAEAIEETFGHGPERQRAFDALYNAAGIERQNPLVDWNDAPERTHREVLAAFDLAIATLRQR